jgi:hypothetical protein
MGYRSSGRTKGVSEQSLIQQSLNTQSFTHRVSASLLLGLVASMDREQCRPR